jgi:hypothetical protein
VKIYLLIGLELTSDCEGTGQIATHDRDDCGRHRLLDRAFAIMISNDQEKSCQQKAKKHRDPKDPLTMHGATLLSIPQVGIGLTTVLLIKGTGEHQPSYSMFETRPGLP